MQARVDSYRPGDVVVLDFFQVVQDISATMSSGEKAAKGKGKAPLKTKSTKGTSTLFMLAFKNFGFQSWVLGWFKYIAVHFRGIFPPCLSNISI